MRLIDADKLSAEMYHQAFEVDSDEQRWDSGCWIRYKMFERCLEKQPTINPMKWIPVSERLPEEKGTYLTTTIKGAVRVNHFYGKHWGYSNDAVAWMPLPEPYKEEQCDTKPMN